MQHLLQDRLDLFGPAKRFGDPMSQSNVQTIGERSVTLLTLGGLITIANDNVIVLGGGIPPFEMLKEMGIQFGGKHASRQQSQAPRHQIVQV